MPPTAERLAAALAGLTARIDDVAVASRHVAVASYPDGPRPSSLVTIAGAGEEGLGEHVGWTDAEHARFAAVARRLPRGTRSVSAWRDVIRTLADAAYDRAALEAAVVDLALRQHDTTPFALLGHTPAPVRYVVSFGRAIDPMTCVAAETAAELKLDVDAAWSDARLDALAATRRVAIVDWKTSGTAAEHARIAAPLPGARVEDPGPAAGAWPRLPCAARVSADGWLAAPEDLRTLPAPPAAVNVKVARMGGVFPALALAAAAEHMGIPVYVGGMFEVGPGRAQAQTLAALLAPDGPNDVAPIATDGAPAARPARVVIDAPRPGFGRSA